MKKISLSSVVDMLDSIGSICERINKIADDANNDIACVEDRLRKAQVGIEFWSKKSKLGVTGKMGYGKNDGEWMLLFQHLDYEKPEQAHPSWITLPLLKAPRDIRVSAAEQLPVFLEEIHSYLFGLVNELEAEKVDAENIRKGLI